MDRGHQDVLLDPVEHLVVHQRRGTIGAHAAGVRAGVAVERRLVVLGRLERDDRLPVGNRQHAGLLAVEPLLDHQPVAGGAEDFLAGDLLDRSDGLVAAGADDDALARGQPVGLDHHRHVLAVLEELDGVVGVGEGLIIGRWDVGVAEQVLAEDLAALQFGGGAAGTEDPQPGLLEGVDDAGGQRAFRPDDGQPHVVFLGEPDQGGEVGRLDVDVFAVEIGAGVAWGHEDAVVRGGFG